MTFLYALVIATRVLIADEILEITEKNRPLPADVSHEEIIRLQINKFRNTDDPRYLRSATSLHERLLKSGRLSKDLLQSSIQSYQSACMEQFTLDCLKNQLTLRQLYSGLTRHGDEEEITNDKWLKLLRRNIRDFDQIKLQKAKFDKNTHAYENAITASSKADYDRWNSEFHNTIDALGEDSAINRSEHIRGYGIRMGFFFEEPEPPKPQWTPKSATIYKRNSDGSETVNGMTYRYPPLSPGQTGWRTTYPQGATQPVFERVFK